MKHTLFTLALAALLGPPQTLPAQALPSTRVPAPASCASLRALRIPADIIALPTRGAVVHSARISTIRSAHTGVTQFCKVLGEITSVDPAAQPIRFELNLPAHWNGKAVHFGGGGFDGALSKANGLRTPDVGIVADPTPLERGFATFGSDSGHHHHYFFLPDEYNELKARFALNAEQRLNYAHDALKKTHDTAAFLIRAFYGTPAQRMFFLGGSTGGREAYFVTQLWPNDYDGVLGAYAGWDQVQLDLQFVRLSEAEYSPGNKSTRGWLPKSSTRLVASKVMEACDAADGLRDGIISDPAACHFNLQSLACPAGQAHRDCLSAGQLRTFNAFSSEQRTERPLAHGVQTIPGFNVLSGTDLTGSMGLLRHPFHDPAYPLGSFYYQIGSGVLRFYLTRDPNFKALAFNTSTGGAYSNDLLPQSLASDASDADLAPFARHGGKFILLHGTTDATIPTGASVQFFTMLQQTMGPEAVDRFVRFYLVPGYGHTRGVFNAGFDALDILDRWVETGQPPHDLTVVDNNKNEHGRTRPLCRYPTWPRYKAGDPNLASSFTCSE